MRPLTVLAAITTLFAGLTQGRPETNFAGASISSDGSGTKSTQYVGTIPNSGGGGIGTRISSVGQGGSGNGGGIAVVSGQGGGGGGGAVYSGSSNSGGGGSVGIFSRTGPSGTQHTVIGPSGTRVYNQPTGGVGAGAGARFGPSRPNYAYPGAPGYYNDYRNDNYDYYNDGGYNNGYYNQNNGYQPAVAVAGPGGAFAGAGAGGVGAFAGAGGGGSPDYFG